jgi:hypothetical protein
VTQKSNGANEGIWLSMTIALFLVIYIYFRLIGLGNVNPDELLALLSGEKPLLTIIMLLILPKINVPMNHLVTYRVALLVFVLCYSYQLLNGVARPSVFEENNIELMGLFVYWIYAARLSRKKIDHLLLGYVVTISGSITASVVFLVIVGAIFLTEQRRKFIVAGFIFSALIVSYLLYDRSISSINNVDRYHYVVSALSSMAEQGSVVTSIFGFPAATAVPEAVCELSPWKRTDAGICYSNAFQLSWARILWDHGILGVMLVAWLYYKSLIWRGLGQSSSRLIFIIAMIGGFSVSGVGNTYAAIAVAMIIMFRDKRGRNTDQASNGRSKFYRGHYT